MERTNEEKMAQSIRDEIDAEILRDLGMAAAFSTKLEDMMDTFGEWHPIPNININVIKQTVTGSSRKLRATWSVETADELKAWHTGTK